MRTAACVIRTYSTTAVHFKRNRDIGRLFRHFFKDLHMDSSSNKTGGTKWNVIGPVGHEHGGCPPPLLMEQILSIKS